MKMRRELHVTMEKLLAEARQYLLDVESWILNHGGCRDFEDERVLREEMHVAEMRRIVVALERGLLASK